MNSFEEIKGEKIHSRSIEISTYEAGGDHIVVEGRLKDDRLVCTYHISGVKRPPQTVHDMTIRMRIDCSTLTIQEIYTSMPSVPHDECDQTAESLNRLKGMQVSPGFTSRVKKALGGRRGCLHLTTLVLAMAPAIMQGFWTHRRRTPINGQIPTDLMENYLLDTCWVWRREGPLAEQYLKNSPEDS